LGAASSYQSAVTQREKETRWLPNQRGTEVHEGQGPRADGRLTNGSESWKFNPPDRYNVQGGLRKGYFTNKWGFSRKLYIDVHEDGYNYI